MSEQIWGRKVKIFISGDEDSSSRSELDLSRLKCLFSVEENSMRATKTAALKIYNVNTITENFILRKGDTLKIEAGYESEGRYGLIFTGDIIQTISNWEGLDFALEIFAVSGQGLFDTNFIRGQCSSSSPREALNLVAQKAEIPFEFGTISENTEKNKLPRAKAFFGSVKTIIENFARRNGLYIVLDNENKVNILGNGDFLGKNEALILDFQSGIKEAPVLGDDGVKVKMLLEPRLKLFDRVKLAENIIARQFSNAYAGNPSLNMKIDPEGIYRIFSVKHSGDTYGDIWETEIIAKSFNAQTLDANGVLFEK